MRVCFDACVVVDILGGTTDLKDSFAAYDVTCIKEWEPMITASTMGTIVYVLESRKMKTRAAARSAVEVISELFEIIDLTSADINAAYESPMKDYEDAEVAYCAARAGADVIVTRNKGDFANSLVSAMTPAEFLASYQPRDYHCDLINL